ncbi:hypothetical protein HNQ60_004790 [Povalibacter uvarum]|jgi:hypothetical protein|uniref:Uncharacterized protein n=1 Tax=Povalibacter uvarum TaxID=732238 RepID=A0A841HUF4_9GAMM|nr:hypothetical protein [Povalibacter uvarum]MBB6095899.1 hypothetical protein [Povalibacter uvarum]
MRKLAALIVVLGLAGWSLSDGEVLATLAERLDLDGGPNCMARAEPLCPLC